MIHRLENLFVVLALVACHAACGDGGRTPGGTVVESVERTCAKVFACQDTFPGTDAEFMETFGANVSECVDGILSDPTLPAPEDFEASVEAGRIVFHADDAEVCLDTLDARSCAQLWNGGTTAPEECETAFEGQVEDGGACTLDEDCAAVSSECDDSTMTCG